MKVWLVQTGEPVPTDPGRPKLMRTAVLAQHLADRAHDVVLWSCTVDHPAKTQRAAKTTRHTLRKNYELVLLYGRLYTSNISLARVVSQIENAREFRRHAGSIDRPDVILCGYPTIELARAATEYAVRHAVPIAIDFRDKWPDIMESQIPGWARLPAAPVIAYWRRSQRWTVQNATGLVAITEPFLEWALAAGHRARGPHDRAFHLAVDPVVPAHEALVEAERMWDGLGVATDAGHLIVCFIGTLSSRLDLATFVDGFLRLAPEQRRKVKLVICGRGDLHDKLHEIARTEPNLVVPGWRNAAELHVLMRRAHAGILPYRSIEDFVISYPNKVGEYFGAGLPIVTGLSGLVRSLLTERDIGYFYQEGDATSVAGCLLALLEDSASALRKKDAARRTFLELFNPGRIYPAFCDYLEQLATTRRD